MEVKFDENGGFARVSTGHNAMTTLLIKRDGGHIALSMDAHWRKSALSLGVRVSPQKARTIGNHLVELAREIEDDRDE